eukprot:scaffold34699_cov66-Skeletonema_marinoi.AAC.1
MADESEFGVASLGYVIMNDWFGFPSKTSCEDFFAVDGIKPEIIPIDDISAYCGKRLKTSKFNTGVMSSLVLLHGLRCLKCRISILLLHPFSLAFTSHLNNSIKVTFQTKGGVPPTAANI